jgi:hypothetical protein
MQHAQRDACWVEITMTIRIHLQNLHPESEDALVGVDSQINGSACIQARYKTIPQDIHDRFPSLSQHSAAYPLCSKPEA